jgi:hypothetical protein
MSEFFCMKTKTGTSWALVPAHATDVDAIKKLPAHQPVRVKVTRMRNPQFHRKFFALLNYLFDIWVLRASELPFRHLGAGRGESCRREKLRPIPKRHRHPGRVL